ncbi:hypothetical protein [Roseateles violae]|uniref:Uncharacterized protein n=1 Tax=Roseateles violae TaxID=3058042 RepID=A0ABT8DT92_9BURK|nr:hypothetical protein [Pelomonas sp. PFR6]MDN3920235.1 hypothetical protein [Pelomonas sp. PFR6]
MWISEFWYEKLPWVYAGCGLLALWLIGRPAALSATLLFGAAVLTAWWRYSHRR